MLFYLFSADSSIFGGRPNNLGVDEAFADLSVHTITRYEKHEKGKIEMTKQP